MNFIEHSNRISLIASVLETINSHTCENIQHKCLNTRPWSLTGLKSHTQKCFYTVDLLTHIPVGILSIPNSKIVVQQSSMDFTHTPVGILSIPNTKIVVQQFFYEFHSHTCEDTQLFLSLNCRGDYHLVQLFRIPAKIFNIAFITTVAEK